MGVVVYNNSCRLGLAFFARSVRRVYWALGDAGRVYSHTMTELYFFISQTVQFAKFHFATFAGREISAGAPYQARSFCGTSVREFFGIFAPFFPVSPIFSRFDDVRSSGQLWEICSLVGK